MTYLIASAAGGFGRLKIQNVDIQVTFRPKTLARSIRLSWLSIPRGLVNHLGLKRAYGIAGLKEFVCTEKHAV